MENQNPTEVPSGLPGTKPEPLAWGMLEPHIPAEYKDAGLWEPIKGNPAMIFKNYAEAQKRLGSSISLPQEADPEAWGKVYNKLGRPESKDGYQWDPPQHSDIEWQKEELESFKEYAHGKGLTQDQYKSVMDYHASKLMNQANEYNQTTKAEREKAESELKKEYGTNYEFNKQLGVRAATEYFGKDVAEEMGELMVSNPALYKGLFKLGQEMNEAGTFGNISPLDFGGISPESAQAKISELNSADKNTHPYWNNKLPGHDEAVNQALKWFQVAAQKR